MVVKQFPIRMHSFMAPAFPQGSNEQVKKKNYFIRVENTGYYISSGYKCAPRKINNWLNSFSGSNFFMEGTENTFVEQIF